MRLYTQEIFLTVPVTVFLFRKQFPPFIHAGFKPLYKSTYPKEYLQKPLRNQTLRGFLHLAVPRAAQLNKLCFDSSVETELSGTSAQQRLSYKTG